MRTILHFQETGIEKLPLENHLPEPVRTYMDIAMELLIDGQPPEPSQIIRCYSDICKSDENKCM